MEELNTKYKADADDVVGQTVLHYPLAIQEKEISRSLDSMAVFKKQ